MSLTLTPTKASITCTECGFVRTWPRDFHGRFESLADLQAFVAKAWGWTFNGRDACDECSKKLEAR
jgi:hypothetical protein